MRAEALREGAAALAHARSGRGIFPGREGLVPEMLEFWLAFQKLAERQRIPLRVHGGFRSLEQQAEMVRRGVTRAKPGQSAHNFGMAIDVIHTRRAWENMPRDGWAILGAMGKEAARLSEVSVQWGGEWSFYDPAHWELADWRVRVELALI